MEKERKTKLLGYIFPSAQAQEFMCNNVFVELDSSIPSRVCISSKNTCPAVRKENLNLVKAKILAYLAINYDCKNEILKIYKKDCIQDVLEEILLGYVFYISQTNPKFSNIDIFRDKRSICFAPVSIVDIL